MWAKNQLPKNLFYLFVRNRSVSSKATKTLKVFSAAALSEIFCQFIFSFYGYANVEQSFMASTQRRTTRLKEFGALKKS